MRSGRERAAGSDAAEKGQIGRTAAGTGETIARIRMEFPGFKNGIIPDEEVDQVYSSPEGPCQGASALSGMRGMSGLCDATGLREKARHTHGAAIYKEKADSNSEMRLPVPGAGQNTGVLQRAGFTRQWRLLYGPLRHWWQISRSMELPAFEGGGSDDSSCVR